MRRQLDAQFQHHDTVYTGGVVEVSYSQDGKDLQKPAQDCILYSNADIKVVVAIDINYGGKESTVSLWWPKYTRKDNEDFGVLEGRQELACTVRHILPPRRPRTGQSSHFGLLMDWLSIMENA